MKDDRHLSPQQRMGAFDGLPPVLRRTIANASSSWNPCLLSGAVRLGASPKQLASQIASIDIAELEAVRREMGGRR